MIKTVRNENLLNSVIFVDGQAGCGKTLFNPILSCFKNVENFNYSTEIENICTLNFMNKIHNDSAISMIKIQLDHILYEAMMSRRLNFRPTDLTSIFRSHKKEIYIKRLLSKGDEKIPEEIKKKSPILNLATHNLLPYSEPIFKTFRNKIFFIEIIRHPLYMLIQQTLNHKNFMKKNGSARQFHVYISYGKYQIPHFFLGSEEEYLDCNATERSILEMSIMTNLVKKNKKSVLQKYANKILTIPFEYFVTKPDIYIKKIEKFLKVKKTKYLSKIMIRENVPRKKISDGIPLDIYKRCGWKPPEKSFNESQELKKRREYAILEGVRKEYLDILDRLSEQYEKTNLIGIL